MIPILHFHYLVRVQIPVLYLGIIVLMIPITGNTINSIDVLNGVASGFMAIASFSLSIALFILQNYEMAIISLPLGMVSLAFYKYHKIPSKIFPGDSWGTSIGGNVWYNRNCSPGGNCSRSCPLTCRDKLFFVPGKHEKNRRAQAN